MEPRQPISARSAYQKNGCDFFFFLFSGDLRRKRVHDGVDAVGDKPKKEKRCGALRVW